MFFFLRITFPELDVPFFFTFKSVYSRSKQEQVLRTSSVSSNSYEPAHAGGVVYLTRMFANVFLSFSLISVVL